MDIILTYFSFLMDRAEQTDEIVCNYKLPINLWEHMSYYIIFNILLIKWYCHICVRSGLKTGALSKDINFEHTWWKTKEIIKCFCVCLYLRYNKILNTKVLLYIESAIGLDPREWYLRLMITDE